MIVMSPPPIRQDISDRPTSPYKFLESTTKGLIERAKSWLYGPQNQSASNQSEKRVTFAEDFEEVRYFLTEKAIKEMQRKPHIETPGFRKVSRVLPRKGRIGEKLDSPTFLKRHKSLENAEKRERRRETEYLRYEQYIKDLKRKNPELWKY